MPGARRDRAERRISELGACSSPPLLFTAYFSEVVPLERPRSNTTCHFKRSSKTLKKGFLRAPPALIHQVGGEIFHPAKRRGLWFGALCLAFCQRWQPGISPRTSARPDRATRRAPRTILGIITGMLLDSDIFVTAPENRSTFLKSLLPGRENFGQTHHLRAPLCLPTLAQTPAPKPNAGAPQPGGFEPPRGSLHRFPPSTAQPHPTH